MEYAVEGLIAVVFVVLPLLVGRLCHVGNDKKEEG